MAAFCACCGAEITMKAETCPACGMPRHGMLQSDVQPSLDCDFCPAIEPDPRPDPSPTATS